MKVLVVNCGSSSLKFQLIETDGERVIAKGLCERIGIDGHFIYAGNGEKYDRSVAIPDHDEAVRLTIEALINPVSGAIGSLDEIDAVGHRIAHGGDKFDRATILNAETMKEIEACSHLAPIHNPVNIIGIKACMKYMPDTPMVGVFDTSFHHTMPEEAYLYGIPYEYYKNNGIRRYGFHGMSHEYVAGETAKLLGKPLEDTRIITCHLGNGASIAAVKDGESIDTSMGYTPLAGIIMGTRSGSIDPEIINVIASDENKSVSEVMNILNNKSGLYGLSDNLSSDVRDLTEEYKKGNENAVRALNKYAYSIVKYIGAYSVILDGVDAITFTAGVGEHSALIRRLICDRLGSLGVKIDNAKNNDPGEDMEISKWDSKVKVYVIPTNEEMSIARQTVKVVNEELITFA